MAATTLHGKCYCSALEFEATTPGEPTVIHCHCKECREWTGSIAYSAVACASVTFTKGTPKVFQRTGGPEKSFCGDCGTGVMNNVSFGPYKHTVAAGLFQESVTLQTQMHCQVHEKIPWADCSADGKPVFQKFPGAADVQ
mmetsp:Transcript_13828/g.36639  ORF Transcript_13828/g.36639 Transcript_13828/m.36639 type:complete len:140 (-) Transcript_13828:116-535(-)